LWLIKLALKGMALVTIITIGCDLDALYEYMGQRQWVQSLAPAKLFEIYTFCCGGCQAKILYIVYFLF